MAEEILFEYEAEKRRQEAARYLRTVADKLESGGPITLEAGSETVTLEPPETIEFEVKAEREGPADGSGELSIEFELEWPEDATADEGGLAIE